MNMDALLSFSLSLSLSLSVCVHQSLTSCSLFPFISFINRKCDSFEEWEIFSTLGWVWGLDGEGVCVCVCVIEGGCLYWPCCKERSAELHETYSLASLFTQMPALTLNPSTHRFTH